MTMVRAAMGLALGLTIGTSAMMATQPAHSANVHSTVSSYNDGFTTSKKDDCQQGFQPACAWLARTGR